MGLDKIRLKINSLDAKIISLLAKRQALMPAVGAFKRQNKLPINQPTREAEILKKLQQMAKAEGLNPALAKKIFAAVFIDSKRIQRKS